ncbi:hypothetical protein IW262DRAFT_1278795, partial [Armillaria fumosa]
MDGYFSDIEDSFEVIPDVWIDSEIDSNSPAGQETVSDEGDEAYTCTFNSAFLAGTGNSSLVETELYDSGASRHMSPYRHRFINFVSINPKDITAADNGKFSALGRGDMRITIP